MQRRGGGIIKYTKKVQKQLGDKKGKRKYGILKVDKNARKEKS